MRLKIMILVLIAAVLLTVAIGYYLDNQSSGKEKHSSLNGGSLQANTEVSTNNGLYSPSSEKESSTKNALSSKLTTSPKKEEKGKSPYTAYQYGGSSDSDNSGSGGSATSVPPIIDIIDINESIDVCVVTGPPPAIPESLFKQ